MAQHEDRPAGVKVSMAALQQAIAAVAAQELTVPAASCLRTVRTAYQGQTVSRLAPPYSHQLHSRNATGASTAIVRGCFGLLINVATKRASIF